MSLVKALANTKLPTAAHINKNAKDILARLMATENISIQHKSGIATSMFDTDKRTLYMPIFQNISKNLYDMLLGHEVGHALDSPNLKVVLPPIVQKIDPKNPKGVKSFLNVVEDARIERKIKQRFPGLRRIFTEAYREFHEIDGFGLKKAGIPVQALPFIDKINVHFKLGAQANVQFTPKEMKYVQMVEDCETFDDVVRAVEAIYEYSKQESMSSQSHEPQENEGGEGDEEGEGQEGDGEGDGEGEGDGDSSGEGDEDGNSDGEGKDGKDGKEGKDGKNKGKGEGQSNGKDKKKGKHNSPGNENLAKNKPENNKNKSKQNGKVPPGQTGGSTWNPGLSEPGPLVSRTDEAIEKAREQLVQQRADDFEYLTVPKNVAHEPFVIKFDSYMQEMQKHIGDNTRTSAQKFREKNNNIISYMIKEFEMRKAAEVAAREMISKTGTIDTNKLHTYKYNDDIFRRVRSVPRGKNHGVVMFLDWSGSMDSHIAGTIEQMMNIILFCKRAQIPFDVYAFMSPINEGWGRKYEYQHKNAQEGDIIINQHSLLHLISSRLSANKYQQAIQGLIRYHDFYSARRGTRTGVQQGSVPSKYGMGGTPLNSAIMSAVDIVTKFRVANKLEIVNTIFLTDGDSEALSAKSDGRGSYTNIKNSNGVIRDGLSKAEYSVENVHGYEGTSTLLKILKDRTGSNTFGFYIVDKNYFQAALQSKVPGIDSQTVRKAQEEFNKTGIYTIEGAAGYDEYYIIAGGAELQVNDKEFDIANAKSTDAVATRFAEFQKSKSFNRKMLTKFITRMAK